MRTDTLSPATVLAFLHGAVVLPAAGYTLLTLGSRLGTSSDPPLILAWIALVVGLTVVVSLVPDATAPDLLAGTTLGITTSFVLVPTFLREPGVVVLAIGAIAVLATLVGVGVTLALGQGFSGERASADGARRWGVTLVAVVLIALLVSFVDGLRYWYQGAAWVSPAPRVALLAGVAVLGVVGPTRIDLDVRTLLGGVAVLPFLVPLTPVGVFDETTVRLSAEVTTVLAAVLLAAVLGGRVGSHSR